MCEGRGTDRIAKGYNPEELHEFVRKVVRQQSDPDFTLYFNGASNPWILIGVSFALGFWVGYLTRWL